MGSLRDHLMCVYHITRREELDCFIKYGLCLVAFQTGWCAPCRLQAPIVERLAADFQGQAKIAAADVDDLSDFAMSSHIRSIPTLILYQDGQEITRFVGLQSEGVLSAALRKAFPG